MRTADGGELAVDRALNTMASVPYDAVAVPGGDASVEALAGDGYAVHFVAEAVKHAKPVAALGGSARLVERATAGAVSLSGDGGTVTDHGVLAAESAGGTLPDGFADAFCEALATHRIWDRPTAAIPA